MFNSIAKVIIVLFLIFLAVGVVWTNANSYLTGTSVTTHPSLTAQDKATNTAVTLPSTATPSHRLVTLNAQNTRVAAVTDNAVLVWALDSGKLLATFDSSNRSITDIAFSPDGLSLAASANDGSVLIWQVP